MNFTNLYNLLESKLSNISQENYAPLLSPETREKAIFFFKRYGEGTDASKSLNWQNHRNFTDKDFKFLDDIISTDKDGNLYFTQKSKTQLKRDSFNKEASAEEIFSNKDMFHIYPEISNEEWLFLSPLNKRAAEFINSVECGGVGAKWCIGWKDPKGDFYWEDYTSNVNCYLVLAFNKHYKTLDNIKYKGTPIDPEATNPWNIKNRWDNNGNPSKEVCSNKELFTKFMFEINTEEHNLANKKVSVWLQPDLEIDSIESLEATFNINFGVSKQDIVNLDFFEFDNKNPERERIVNRWASSLLNIGWEVDTRNKSVIVPEGVTTIEDDLFRNKSTIKSIQLPSTLKSIESLAFYNCKKLEEINLPEGLNSIGENAFFGCNSLEKIKIPSSLKTITKKAFRGCNGLKYIDIPSSIESIEDSAFENCPNLEKINIPSSVKKLGSNIFNNCYSLNYIDIPESVTQLEEQAFNNSYFIEIKLPNNIQTIEPYLFSNCAILEKVIIPNSVISIGEGAFQNCGELISINIPENITEIEKCTFEGCRKLVNINIPNKINKIGYSAFEGCKSLANINIPNTVTSIGERAFGLCKSLTNINIPNSVFEIGYSAFGGCESLRNIKLSDNISKIEDWLFDSCKNLSSVIIPNNVKSIRNTAFSNCDNLNTLSIPSLLDVSELDIPKKCKIIKRNINPIKENIFKDIYNICN